MMLLLYVEKAHGGIQGLKDYLLFTFNRIKWEEKNFRLLGKQKIIIGD